MTLKHCPVCRKRMVPRILDTMLPTDPPEYHYSWWCGCGHEEAGDSFPATPESDLLRGFWERKNRPWWRRWLRRG